MIRYGSRRYTTVGSQRMSCIGGSDVVIEGRGQRGGSGGSGGPCSRAILLVRWLQIARWDLLLARVGSRALCLGASGGMAGM